MSKKPNNEVETTPNTAPQVPEEVVNTDQAELKNDSVVNQETENLEQAKKEFESKALDTKEVNTQKSGPKAKESKKDEFDRLVRETLAGVHGSGRERMISLGSHYAKVQQEVNQRYRDSK